MGTQLVEREIIWIQDLNGSASTTVYPSGASAGVAAPNVRRNASRVHVGLEYTVASGTLSTQIGLYGYTDAMASGAAGTWATSTWVYLGALNAGSSITANAATWTSSATRLAFAEVFSVGGGQYSRYATRAYATGGTTPLVSTYIGFCAD